MIIKDEVDLNLKRTNSLLESVEIDVDSLENQGKEFPGELTKSLKNYLHKEGKVCASIYTYFSQSCNFHETTNSFFVAVSRNGRILVEILNHFSRIEGVRVKASDHINPKNSILQYHIEDSHLWKSYEPGSWWTEDKNGDSDVADNEKNNKIITAKLNSGSPVRYRSARSDASIGSIKKQIEIAFGLPEGSVALVKPDGSKIRSDATIKTLRSQWDY